MFVTGMFLIDASASALNNLGNIERERDDNMVGTKVITTRDGKAYPYVSAQAVRYWLRSTIEQRVDGWKRSPIFRGDKVAHTEGNPLLYDDDDIFGYMRAQPRPTRRKKETEQQINNSAPPGQTETNGTITRLSPFRLSTIEAIAPVRIIQDFGVMARQDDFPVLHHHQFYKATLRGLYSLDLHACGTFSYINRSGYRSLDPLRIEQAKAEGLEHIQSEQEKAYRLPLRERIRRVRMLFEGFAHLEGGAKQTLHYTDVSPVLCIMAITRGGNHLFRYTVKADKAGLPQMNLEALQAELTVQSQELLSSVYVGWAPGYLEEERARVQQFAEQFTTHPIQIMHPWNAYQALIADFEKPENAFWFA